MPLVQISLLAGKPREHRHAIGDGVHRALVETCGVPRDDFFQTIRECAPDEFRFDADYLGIHRTEDVVFISITLGNWRSIDQKRALYRRIAENLAESPGLRPEDVIVVLSPNERSDWSFGNGLASYVVSGESPPDPA